MCSIRQLSITITPPITSGLEMEIREADNKTWDFGYIKLLRRKLLTISRIPFEADTLNSEQCIPIPARISLPEISNIFKSRVCQSVYTGDYAIQCPGIRPLITIWVQYECTWNETNLNFSFIIITIADNASGNLHTIEGNLFAFDWWIFQQNLKQIVLK